MYSDQLNLHGKQGVKRLGQWGAYAVIVNKALYERGQAGKFAVVNVRDAWVDNVFYSRPAATNEAQQLSQQEPPY